MNSWIALLSRGMTSPIDATNKESCLTKLRFQGRIDSVIFILVSHLLFVLKIILMVMEVLTLYS